MKVHFTYNTKIKTCDDVVHHLELEKDKMKSFRLEPEAYVANASMQKNQGSKHKFKGGKGKGKGNVPKKPMSNQQGKGNFLVKNDKSKFKCFNFGKKEHFANECLEPKKVNVQTTHECVTNMLSIVLLI